MIRITVDGEQYEYDQNKMMASEASMIQKYAGRTIVQWTKGLEEGDIDCIIPLVWLIWKRNGRVATIDEVDFDLATFELEDMDAKKKADEDAADAASADPTQAEAATSDGEPDQP